MDGDDLEMSRKGGPFERDFSAKLFDLGPGQFRQLMGELTPALVATSAQAKQRTGMGHGLDLGVDPKQWKAWCGGDILRW